MTIKHKQARVVFDTSLDGHHLEYIHHLYLGAIEEKSIDFIFAIPASFMRLRDSLEFRERLGCEAVSLISRDYTWEKYAGNVVGIYRELIG